MYSSKLSGRKITLPMLVVGGIIILAIAVILLAILVGPNLPSASAEGAKFVQIPQKQNNEQEIKVSVNNTVLYVPDGATNLTGSFVILPLLPDSFSYASEADWYRPIVVDIQYRNSDGVPYHGITFSQPVSICFTLKQDQWLDFKQDADNFQVQYFDDTEAPFHWVSLPLVIDPERNELCTETDHFSIYALAIRAADEIPVTGPTLTSTATITPTNTAVPVINTPESRRDRDEDDRPVVVPPTNTSPPPTNTNPPPTNTNPPPTNTDPPPPPTNTNPPPTNTDPPPPPTNTNPPPPPPPPPTETEQISQANAEPPKSDKPPKPDKPDKPEKPGKPDKHDKPEKPKN